MARMGSSKAGRRVRRQFSEEFRVGAVRLVLDEGKTPPVALITVSVPNQKNIAPSAARM